MSVEKKIDLKMIKNWTYVTGPGSNISLWTNFVVQASLPVELGNTHIKLTYPLVKTKGQETG